MEQGHVQVVIDRGAPPDDLRAALRLDRREPPNRQQAIAPPLGLRPAFTIFWMFKLAQTRPGAGGGSVQHRMWQDSRRPLE